MFPLLAFSTLTTVEIPPPVPTSPSIHTPTQHVAELTFTLDNIFDDILSDMEQDKLCKLVINARATIKIDSSISVLSIAPSNLFSTPKSRFLQALSSSLTPKMNRIRYIALTGGVMIFTDPFIFLTHKLISIPFLVLTRSCSILLPKIRINALLSTRNIFI